MREKNDQKMIFQSALNQTNSSLKSLIQKAQLHQQAEDVVLAALPDNLAPGARFVSLKEGELVLSTDSASKATQLRFRQHEVMAALREHEAFQFVWKLKIKVVPARYQSRTPPQKQPLSKENARLLKEEAGHTKDKALREVLEKLASHVQD